MRGRSRVRVAEVTVKSLKCRLVFTKALYSSRCFSSLCLKPCHENSALGTPRRNARRLLTWKEAMEEKRLRVTAEKTKTMICGTGLDLLQSSGEFPCAVCRTGISPFATAASTGCTRNAVSPSA